MARNRKRAKERRTRRPQAASVTAERRRDPDAAPDPIEHAAPDVELAEAQLAAGRPEPLDEPEEAEAPQPTAAVIQATDDEELESEDLDAPAAQPPARRPATGTRLVHFMQGSWRELQRVQWPDRRQVMQATGVVIGFVIIAGAFLGVTDFLAGKLINYILTGHFK